MYRRPMSTSRSICNALSFRRAAPFAAKRLPLLARPGAWPYSRGDCDNQSESMLAYSPAPSFPLLPTPNRSRSPWC